MGETWPAQQRSRRHRCGPVGIKLSIDGEAFRIDFAALAGTDPFARRMQAT